MLSALSWYSGNLVLQEGGCRPYIESEDHRMEGDDRPVKWFNEIDKFLAFARDIIPEGTMDRVSAEDWNVIMQVERDRPLKHLTAKSLTALQSNRHVVQQSNSDGVSLLQYGTGS